MFSFLFPPRGPAADVAKKLRRDRVFRWARFDRRSTGRHVRKLVVAIGQVHPVLHGRFSWFGARRIAKVQLWIFEVCRHLFLEWGIHSFGQEGFHSVMGEVTRARLNAQLLEEFRKSTRSHKDAWRFLKSVAQQWRRALRRGTRDESSHYATALNALSLLQALEQRVTVFPIEQQDVHSRITEGVTRLWTDIKHVESSSLYQAVRCKEGKKLTKEEYEIARERNALVETFNNALKHPERDRSILREVLEHTEGPLTVFILGQGHRRGFLKLAKQYLPSDVLFVWVTPPRLRTNLFIVS